jgi:hypothetical protein
MPEKKKKKSDRRSSIVILLSSIVKGDGPLENVKDTHTMRGGKLYSL